MEDKLLTNTPGENETVRVPQVLSIEKIEVPLGEIPHSDLTVHAKRANALMRFAAYYRDDIAARLRENRKTADHDLDILSGETPEPTTV